MAVGRMSSAVTGYIVLSAQKPDTWAFVWNKVPLLHSSTCSIDLSLLCMFYIRL